MAALVFFLSKPTLNNWYWDLFLAIFSLMIIRFWIVKMRNTVLARHHSFTTINELVSIHFEPFVERTHWKTTIKNGNFNTSTFSIHTSSHISFERSHLKFCLMCAVLFCYCSLTVLFPSIVVNRVKYCLFTQPNFFVFFFINYSHTLLRSYRESTISQCCHWFSKKMSFYKYMLVSTNFVSFSLEIFI